MYPTLPKGAINLSSMGKGRFLPSLLVLIVPFFSGSAFAARPLTTDDAYTVTTGTFQLETGVDFLRHPNDNSELKPSVFLTYGLLGRMDVGVGSRYLFEYPKEGKSESGLGDTELKIKYRFVDEEDWFPAFAIAGRLKIPTASESKGFGSGKMDLNINTIVTKQFGKKWLLNLNLGYTFTGEHRLDNEFNYSSSVQFILSDKWTLVGEVVGVNNFNGRNGDDPLSGLLGTQYNITENAVWDAGIEIGMNRAAPNFRLTTGVTFFFKP